MSTDFAHDQPGVTAQRWRDDPRWSEVPALAVPDDVDRLVVVAAHPDDGSLGAAGLMRTSHRAGRAVHLVLLTAGEHSEAALQLAAPRATSDFLAVADGAVAAAEPDLTTALVDIVGDGRHTLLVAPWRHDGHPDHEAAGRAAAAAARRTGARLLEYPVWRWHHTTPDDLPEADWAGLRGLPLDAETAATKRRCVAAHRTQVLDPAFLAHFAGDRETFLQQEPEDAALDGLHAREEEPWGADVRWYEERKRQLLLAVLPRQRFDHGLEVGCSTGVLAAALAGRCERLTAIDASSAALARARDRLAGLPGVTLARCDLPREWPPGRFDLVVCSEVGYFLSPADVDRLADRVRTSLADAGVVVLCHWRHAITGWVLDGPEVHERLVERLGLPTCAVYRDDDVELLLLGATGTLPDPTR